MVGQTPALGIIGISGNYVANQYGGGGGGTYVFLGDLDTPLLVAGALDLPMHPAQLHRLHACSTRLCGDGHEVDMCHSMMAAPPDSHSLPGGGAGGGSGSNNAINAVAANTTTAPMGGAGGPK